MSRWGVLDSGIQEFLRYKRSGLKFSFVKVVNWGVINLGWAETVIIFNAGH